MATTSGSTTDNSSADQLKSALTTADNTVVQGMQNLQSVHQARLAQANRTLTAITAQYGADDPRVKTTQAAVAARTTTIGRILMAQRQLVVSEVQVAANGWALQGQVLDSNLQPLPRFTVFFVDANKDFLKQYGFAYTDATGYYVLNYAGDPTGAAAPQLFLEVVDMKANPVYLSPTQFVPVAGSTSYQNVVLAPGGQPIGDPTETIRAVAIPPNQASPTSDSPKSKS
jgi:hypothetical protein